MEYGGPCYKRNGQVEVGFASQKDFIDLYVLRADVRNADKEQWKVKGVSFGKGPILAPEPSGSTLMSSKAGCGPLC